MMMQEYKNLKKTLGASGYSLVEEETEQSFDNQHALFVKSNMFSEVAIDRGSCEVLWFAFAIQNRRYALNTWRVAFELDGERGGNPLLEISMQEFIEKNISRIEAYTRKYFKELKIATD